MFVIPSRRKHSRKRVRETIRGGAGARRASSADPHGERRLHAPIRDEYGLQFSEMFEQTVAYVTGTPANVVNPSVLDHGTRAVNYT